MVEAAGGLCLIGEAEAELLFFLRFLASQRNRLYCDETIDLRIASLVDDAHGAASQLCLDRVLADLVCGGH